MHNKNSRLKLAQVRAESTINKVNEEINKLGIYTSDLYCELTSIQKIFDEIRNVPEEKIIEYQELKEIRLNWKQQALKIESDYKNAVVSNTSKGIAGAGAGLAVITLGPTTAMGIATTFGVASTGTAISALSGAAATNAALAWLGGGALAAGGGGIIAGNAFLALAGPIGWAIAGGAIVVSGFQLWKRKINQNRLVDIFTLMSNRDIKSYELAIVEINERIIRIKEEGHKLNCAKERIRGFGLDYNLMTEAQQYELGSYVNLMNSTTQLLVNPILGLQPKFDMRDFKDYINFSREKIEINQSSLIIFLSNLLYNINLDHKDEILLWKSFKRNKKFLKSIGLEKADFKYSVMKTVQNVLKHKYISEIS